MPRPRKKERNRAMYEEWLKGNYGSYKALGLRYGMDDPSYTYKVIMREKKEIETGETIYIRKKYESS